MKQSRQQAKRERLENYERLVSEYEGPLLRYATRILGNRETAQDVVQDTFIKLFKSWTDAFVPSPQLASWLYRVAHNRAVDAIRRESRRTRLHKLHAKERPNSTPPNRGEEFRITEAAAAADAALRTLNLREQQLVILKVYEEKSYKEISEIVDISVGNVGYILHHAMKKMAKILNRQKAEDPVDPATCKPEEDV